MKSSSCYSSLEGRHLLELWTAKGFSFAHFVDTTSYCHCDNLNHRQHEQAEKGHTEQKVLAGKDHCRKMRTEQHSASSGFVKSNMKFYILTHTHTHKNLIKFMNNSSFFELLKNSWKFWACQLQEGRMKIGIWKEKWRQAWCLYNTTKSSAKAWEKQGNSIVLTQFFVEPTHWGFVFSNCHLEFF